MDKMEQWPLGNVYFKSLELISMAQSKHEHTEGFFIDYMDFCTAQTSGH